MLCVLFQYAPACVRAIPQVRGATKNQSLSFLMGPPTLADMSNSLSVLFDAVRPRARNSSLRLLPSRLSFE